MNILIKQRIYTPAKRFKIKLQLGKEFLPHKMSPFSLLYTWAAKTSQAKLLPEYLLICNQKRKI